MNRIMLAAAAVLAMLVIAGVLTGTPTPPTTSSTATTPTTASRPAVTVGDAAPAPDHQAGADTAPPAPRTAAATPRDLARTFAAQQANWSYQTIARQYARLANLATGPLRTQLRQAAHDSRLDSTLTRDKAATHGTILGIDIQGHGDRRRIIAATREQADRDGTPDLQGQRSRVYIGTTTRTLAGWIMTAWQPQP